MALTRRFLVALGIEPDKIDEIINAHTETVDALKEERDGYKADAEKLPGVQKELDDVKGKAGFEEKYNTLKAEYDKYKGDIAAKETAAKKQAAYKKLLVKAGISEKRIDSVLKVSDVNGVELDDSGEVKDADAKVEALKEEWADFISTEGVKGASTAKPPKKEHDGDDGGKSRAAKVAEKYYENLYGGEKE